MGQVTVTLDGRQLGLGDEDSPRLRFEGTGAGLVLDRLELGHGRIALRALDGRFLAVRPDPGLSYGVYPEDELTPAAAFEEVLWPTGQVSLRSCHLTYVGADAAGRIIVNRTEAGPLERFHLVAMPSATMPAQRQPTSTPAPATTAT
ncbi:MAG: hypothetical protein AVDCRST_MAG47-2532 [uncultured Nocardioidaceae bacterium]|uniref:Uncharacterized protein n=1 Tax=uncultured Nocardioidaceae bacterium TaxID=253824 RepID=A0A6J4NI53_9ACTN|nr:MAG: hypothetical protein AVDCRST_MAG47-2532 [uncultured Nocardioidaceae bacterium]